MRIYKAISPHWHMAALVIFSCCCLSASCASDEEESTTTPDSGQQQDASGEDFQDAASDSGAQTDMGTNDTSMADTGDGIEDTTPMNDVSNASDTQPEADVAVSDTAREDVAIDATTDVGLDATEDVATDTEVDVALDAATDAADTATDVAPDTATDATDIGVDVSADTTSDAADVATDVSSDAADTAMDVASDTATDATDVSDTSTSDTTVEPGDFTDDFAGDGELVGYTTNNAEALPGVVRREGRYWAPLRDNTNNVTLHFNDAQGRLDAKRLRFPFDVVARNIGIGTEADAQTAASPAGNPYLFAGIQVHVTELGDRNSSHVVVGHRGPTHFTIEGKHTINSNSRVNDAGANIVPDGRADLRIVGNADRTLTVYWQVPNRAPGVVPDNWTLYRGDGELPGDTPAYGAEVYVGLITYAFNVGGVPFVGTCDGLEGGSLR